MTEVPEENLAEEAEPTAPADPEEYAADESTAVSPDTGTRYGGTGEPDRTPHDDELEDGAP